jgi:hypothetical protein
LLDADSLDNSSEETDKDNDSAYMSGPKIYAQFHRYNSGLFFQILLGLRATRSARISEIPGVQ